jgi:predicted ribosomally synthesized peptide with SipW-like signal peptide
MKKIFRSALLVVAIAAIAGYATYSFFSDTETSNNNTFTAGAIDLKVDSQCSYNGVKDDCSGKWDLKDLDANNDKFFNFSDIKPGDFGENTISLHVDNNDAWACVTIDGMVGADNTCTEPEQVAEGGVCKSTGDLAENLYFTAWADDGDNVWEAGEKLLFTNEYGPASDVLNGKTYALADSTTGTAIPGGTTQYIGIKWCAGKMTISEGNDGARVIACDGSAMDNKSQTDSMTANIKFYVEQARNNPTFKCVNPTDNNKDTLILENKDANFTQLTNDQTIGTLVFDKSASTFNYSLEAQGLSLSTSYSLIYYADGWPGNNPGALIGTFSTDVSGNISMANQSYDFGYDLPNSADANSATGAKIWLIPTSAYNSGSHSVTTWPFTDKWLFETNLIHYDDTNI